MDKIKIYNSLTKKLEVLSPTIPGHISMYSCGPTVYNSAHIGNLRAYTCADIMRRVFIFTGYTVAHIMNITDIGHLQHDEIDAGEDKMSLALKREGKPFTLDAMKEIAIKYYDLFRADTDKMNILPADLYPFASDHITEDIVFISTLLEKNIAYKTEDGIYFDITKIPTYGELGGLSVSEEVQSRLSHDISQKRNSRDFSLWKFNNALGYDAPFGKGFPGWHIECSVMSMKYLGGITNDMSKRTLTDFETFDVHTGGIDHIPVHHNNEIAQTRAVSGKILANYWIHNAHVIIDGGKKMAKSGENFITLDRLLESKIEPGDLRYWFLGAKYRTPINYSIEALQDARRSRLNLIQIVVDLKKYALVTEPENTDETSRFKEKFADIISNDFDTPGGMALLWSLLRDTDSALNPNTKLACISIADTILGLNLIENADEKMAYINKPIPDHVIKIAETRKEARDNKDWKLSDDLRIEIQNHGYDIIDLPANSYEIFLKE